MDFVLIPTDVLRSKKFRALKTTDRRACLDAYVHIVEYYVFWDPNFQVLSDMYVQQGHLGWKIRDSKTGIAKEIGVDPRSFRERIWPNLMNLGLLGHVRQGDAVIWLWL